MDYFEAVGRTLRIGPGLEGPLVKTRVMIRVIIAENQTLIRRGLRLVCGESKEVVVVGDTGDLMKVGDLVVTHAANVAIMSTCFGEIECLNEIRMLRKRIDPLRILIVGRSDRLELVARMIKEGAVGFISTDATPGELHEAIKTIGAGGNHMDGAINDFITGKNNSADGKPAHGLLSNREYQVLCLIGSGRTLTQCGEDLTLSVKTISTYRSRLLTKLEMKNNAELTRYVIVNNLGT